MVLQGDLQVSAPSQRTVRQPPPLFDPNPASGPTRAVLAGALGGARCASARIAEDAPRGCKGAYDPPVSPIKGHRYHPIPDTARRRHGHHRIRDRKISGYRPIGNDLTRKSARGQSKRHVSAVCWRWGASVPRDPPSRPSIPEPTPCACSSADAAEAKCRGRCSSRRVAQAPGRPEACREGQAAGGVCPAASRQGWLEGRRRCAVQELPSCWWCMPSCWWVCPSVYSACELCVCSVPGFSEALETFYTVARDVT